MRDRRSAMDLQAALRSIVGDDHVLTDPDLLEAYSIDWTGRFQGRTDTVVRPAGTEEVAAVVAVCAQRRVAVTVQGGNTGMVGGGVPMNGECVLSLGRMSGVSDVDDLAGHATARAGTTVTELQSAAEAAGWSYGVDLGSRDSATVGGTVATNAGGLRMIRYGNTRAQLLGMEAVLGDGRVVSHLSGLPKDNTGYDLASLLCGSEGTLGIVTAARLKLVPLAHRRVTAVMSFADVGEAVSAAANLRRRVRSIEALELFLDSGLELVCSTFGIEKPFSKDHPVYLLVEAADADDPTDTLSEAVGAVEGLRDVAVAVDPERRAALWRYREGHTEAVNALGAPHKLDVSLPLGNVARFAGEVTTIVNSVAPKAQVWLFGHVGDGNVHVNVTGLAPEDEKVDDKVLSLAASMGGSISAEHGIGLAKRKWLRLNRSKEEIDAFRAIKRALDPAGILNPNVLFVNGN